MHKGTIAVYDESARYWADTRKGADGGEERSRTAAERLRALAGTGRILDLGCGPGRSFAALGSPTIGLDASFGMLGLAAGATPLVAADLEHLPIASASAAGAFGNFSFQHLPSLAMRRALAEAARVLVVGGHLFLAMHAGDYEGDARPGDDLPGRWFTMWTAERLHPELADAGFAIVESRTESGTIRVIATRR